MLSAPIDTGQTLAVGSIEDFLTAGEEHQLIVIMDSLLRKAGASRFGDGRRKSIHEVPGLTTAEAMTVYEPQGRIEIPAIPAEAEALLQGAFTRAHDPVSRVMPAISACRPWTYIEYGPGQHITSHLDGIAPDPLAWPRQVAGISVIIGEPGDGGEFFVESTSSSRLWSTRTSSADDGYAPATWLAHDGADNSSDWFREMPRTRWTASAAPRTALLYGSQLAHGTQPVHTGRIRKFISWLVVEQTAPPREG